MTSRLRRDLDFAVVGAGLAGIRTAADLGAAGAQMTLLEARERETEPCPPGH